MNDFEIGGGGGNTPLQNDLKVLSMGTLNIINNYLSHRVFLVTFLVTVKSEHSLNEKPWLDHVTKLYLKLQIILWV